MKLTIVCGEKILVLELAEDMTLADFIALCKMDAPELEPLPVDRLRIMANGRLLVPSESTLVQSIKSFGISDNDMLVIEAATTAAPPPTTQQRRVRQVPTGAGTSAGQQPVDISAIVATLAKGIKVPGASKPSSAGPSVAERERMVSRELFKKMTDPGHRQNLQFTAKEVFDAYQADPTNYEAFHAAFVHFKNERERLERLVEEDPMNEEAQAFAYAQIQQMNIYKSHDRAYEVSPELFIPVNMLWVKLKVNEHVVIAFVDSGAQTSIMSQECADRCNISRLMDKRYIGKARGVGGFGEILGRVHGCRVQIATHEFDCSFEIMKDRHIDLLLGLNSMRRHQMCIDLKKGVLRLGDGTETPFLDEETLKRERAALGISDRNEEHEEEDEAMDATETKKQKQ